MCTLDGRGGGCVVQLKSCRGCAHLVEEEGGNCLCERV